MAKAPSRRLSGVAWLFCIGAIRRRHNFRYCKVVIAVEFPLAELRNYGENYESR
jgi:hypothetical protein